MEEIVKKYIENDLRALNKKYTKLICIRSNIDRISQQVEKIINKYLIEDIHLACSEVGGDGITIVDKEGNLAVLEDVIMLIENKGKFTYKCFLEITA